MRRRTMLSMLASLLSVPAIAPGAAGAGEYVGKVNHVHDDGTLRMDYKGGQIRVRLEGVEPGNWPSLKQALQQRVVGRQVRVEGVSWRDGYLFGRVYVDGRRLGSELPADD